MAGGFRLRRAGRAGPGAGLWLPLGLAVLAGLVASAGSVMLAGAFAGVVVGSALLFAPNLLFAITLVFALVIGGLAEFYLGIGQANWIGSGLGLALGAAALLARPSETRAPAVWPSVLPLVALYLLLLGMSSAINGNSVLQAIVGLRGYLPFVGILLALRYAVPERHLARVPAWLVGIGLLQLPFCLHQAIFVARQRQHSLGAIGGEAEAVVGTFGGDPLGGGYTGEMAIFVLLAAFVALAVRPASRAARAAFALMPLVALACVGLAETKIVFVLTPMVAVLVFLEEVRSSPKRLFALVAGVLAMLAIVAGIYAWRFWTKSPDEVWHAFTYSFDPDFMVDRLHRGRIAALFHWWQNNVEPLDALHSLLGWGMASTLEASRLLGQGNAVLQFGYGLDAHAASKLLWDGGLLGFGAFVAIIGRTGLNAHRLIRQGGLAPVHLGLVKVARGAMLAFLVILPYQVSVIGGAPMQALFWLMVGTVEFWRVRGLAGAAR